jgi:GT2 family glycosyltransferase
MAQPCTTPDVRTTIVIPTRDRPVAIAMAVRAALAAARPDTEIVVVDQSADDRTERGLEEFVRTGRITLVRSTQRGVANARNLGASVASGALVLCTDDDCEPATDWVVAMERVFDSDPAIGIAFGPVGLARSLDDDEFAAEFRPRTGVYDRRVARPGAPSGISANMAARLDTLRALGGFDPSLGVGGRFPSAAETDLAVRAVGRGIRVVDVPAPLVVHHGIRAADASSDLAYRYAVGLGAAFCKAARLGFDPGRTLLVRWVVHFAWRTAGNLVRGCRPTGARFLAGLVVGAVRALRVPVDRSTGLFEQARSEQVDLAPLR